MKLSIIIPVFNSSKILKSLISEINLYLNNKLKNNFEIILINDSSTDNSWNTIKDLSINNSFIKGLNLAENVGQHGAIFIGLKFSVGQKIIIMDDDMQHPPKCLISIYNKLDEADACYTTYVKRKHIFWKILISKTNHLFSNFLFDKPFVIYLSSLKGISENIKDKIIKKKPSIPFIDSLILRETRNIASIEINHQERFDGDSNYGLKKLFILWFDMIENFHFFPIRFGTSIGLLSYCFVKLLRLFKRKKIFQYSIKETTF